MERAQEALSTEIVNRGVHESGPYAGSPSFTVRVRRGIPDFLGSVNLRYVKLGYIYLFSSHGFYFFTSLLIFIFTFRFGILTLPMLALSIFFFQLCHYLTPRSIYLVDFACYRPPDQLKVLLFTIERSNFLTPHFLEITKSEFIELARKSGHFDDEAIEFQQQVLNQSGIGDESYLPRVVFEPGHTINLRDGREEAAMVIFGAIDDLLASTNKISVKDIGILVLNCGVLNTTPSLSAMVINRYKLRHNIESYNLGGMGCAAGVIAIDLARDLLNAHPGSYALVVSTEIVSFTWYSGNEIDMLLPNCFFRMGAVAVLLSSRHLDRWRSKYQLKQLVRTHKGMDDKSFKSIQLKEDREGRQGLSVSKDVIEVGGHALKANITTLGPLVLPISEQAHFFANLLSNKESKPYIPNYKLAFEHVCISASCKKVLDEIQKNLNLSEDYMDASRRTFERFGNTSSSSIWYELAYLEYKAKIKRGDRVWQVALGSGFKCNSAVWKALRKNDCPSHNPWFA